MDELDEGGGFDVRVGPGPTRAASQDDEKRITQGGPVFDNLYQYFRTKRG